VFKPTIFQPPILHWITSGETAPGARRTRVSTPGGKQIIKVDIRIMTATHQDLEKAIVEQIFREDLY
jgi:hypothetical protein